MYDTLLALFEKMKMLDTSLQAINSKLTDLTNRIDVLAQKVDASTTVPCTHNDMTRNTSHY